MSCGSGVCWATGGACINVEVLDVGVVQLQMKKITHMLLMFDFTDYCNLYHVCMCACVVLLKFCGFGFRDETGFNRLGVMKRI